MAELLNELHVMSTVAEIMAPLHRDERRRVIEWLSDYFNVYGEELVLAEDLSEIVDAPEAVVTIVSEEVEEEPEAEAEAEVEYEEPVAEEAAPLTFESFYGQVAPKTAIQKIVTAAYWLETQEGKESWKSFEVNKLLKSIGVKVTSVSGTLAIDAKKPSPLTVVLEKSGGSMQSRKTFALSVEGQQFIEDRLN